MDLIDLILGLLNTFSETNYSENKDDIRALKQIYFFYSQTEKIY